MEFGSFCGYSFGGTPSHQLKKGYYQSFVVLCTIVKRVESDQLNLDLLKQIFSVDSRIKTGNSAKNLAGT